MGTPLNFDCVERTPCHVHRWLIRQGSFDSAGTSLREVPAALRM